MSSSLRNGVTHLVLEVIHLGRAADGSRYRRWRVPKGCLKETASAVRIGKRRCRTAPHSISYAPMQNWTASARARFYRPIPTAAPVALLDVTIEPTSENWVVMLKTQVQAPTAQSAAQSAQDNFERAAGAARLVLNSSHRSVRKAKRCERARRQWHVQRHNFSRCFSDDRSKAD